MGPVDGGMVGLSVGATVVADVVPVVDVVGVVVVGVVVADVVGVVISQPVNAPYKKPSVIRFNDCCNGGIMAVLLAVITVPTQLSETGMPAGPRNSLTAVANATATLLHVPTGSDTCVLTITSAKPSSFEHANEAPASKLVGHAANIRFSSAACAIQLLLGESGAVISAIPNPTASTTTKRPSKTVVVGVVEVVAVVVVTVVVGVVVVGASVGDAVGLTLGGMLGAAVGLTTGATVGDDVGDLEGTTDGDVVGTIDGPELGATEG